MRSGTLLDASLVDETYYTRSDIHKRYPRTDTRVRLDFQYNPHVNEALKSELRQLEGFYNCKYADGYWSIRYDRTVVNTTIAIFNRFDFDTSVLETYAANAPEPQPPRATKATDVVMGDALALDWPFIEDIEMRDKIREIVKGVPNRKWDGEKKKWLIPIKQAGFLQKRLESLYPPLVEAIGSLDEVQSYIENHAERISISAAAELTNEDTIQDMKSRMEAIFNDDVELFPFQYVGVRFAELAGGRCLIGDDMGIGKTMQAIAYAALHEELWPVLIVCPASVKYNWESEIVKWIANPSLQVVNGWKGELEETDFTIVNYDLIAKREEQLMGMGF